MLFRFWRRQLSDFLRQRWFFGLHWRCSRWYRIKIIVERADVTWGDISFSDADVTFISWFFHFISDYFSQPPRFAGAFDWFRRLCRGLIFSIFVEGSFMLRGLRWGFFILILGFSRCRLLCGKYFLISRQLLSFRFLWCVRPWKHWYISLSFLMPTRCFIFIFFSPSM